MPKAESLGAFIARIREDKDLTYQEIANASGGRISPNYVHDLENGAPTTGLGGDKIVALARGLGESPFVVFALAQGLSLTLKDEDLRRTLEEYSELPAKDKEELGLMKELFRQEVHKRYSKTR